MKKLFGVLFIIVAIALAVVLSSGLHNDEVTITRDNSGWMDKIDDDTPLSLISIPGSHNAAAQYITPSYFLRCQSSSIEEQLKMGYRYFDINVKLKNNRLVMAHDIGTCRKGSFYFSGTLYFEEVIASFKTFLQENPSETIICALRTENDGEEESKAIALINEIIKQEIEGWYLENNIPLLSEVRGKIVLATRYQDDLGLNIAWKDQGSEEILSVGYEENWINLYEKVAVQDRYHYDIANKWRIVQQQLLNCPADYDTLSINFLSASYGRLPHPVKYAEEINELFDTTKLQQNTCYGIVVFDFGDNNLASKVIDTNFSK